jgi:hypothetical protein
MFRLSGESWCPLRAVERPFPSRSLVSSLVAILWWRAADPGLSLTDNSLQLGPEGATSGHLHPAPSAEVHAAGRTILAACAAGHTLGNSSGRPRFPQMSQPNPWMSHFFSDLDQPLANQRHLPFPVGLRVSSGDGALDGTPGALCFTANALRGRRNRFLEHTNLAVAG